ncbi:MAG: restriction endonuclease subunit S [Candidatus Coprovivens sp.]
MKVSLEDIAYYSKDRISHTELNENNYVGVDNLLQNKRGKTNSTHIPTSGNSIKFIKNDILIGNIRPYLRKIWLADCTGGTNGDVLDIRINNTEFVYPKFLYYILSSEDFFEYNNSTSKGSKMPRGDKQAVMKYEFFLPSIEVQRKITSILDKFDKLVNDISEGLPAEIELRKQQYEYYRNKLLDFKEVN